MKHLLLKSAWLFFLNDVVGMEFKTDCFCRVVLEVDHSSRSTYLLEAHWATGPTYL